jgi:hypothetical protein
LVPPRPTGRDGRPCSIAATPQIDAAANIELRLGNPATKGCLEDFDHIVLAIGREEVVPAAGRRANGPWAGAGA